MLTAHTRPQRSASARLLVATILMTLVVAPRAVAQAPAATAGQSATQHLQTAAIEVRQALADIQQIPGSFPAVAAVIVHGDDTPLMYVHGEVRAGQPAQVTANSKFYIASQTKSFMALLGAHLDETGVLPLDTTLAQVWPQLRLPAPVDPAAITLSDLLSHQEQLRTDTLNFLTAYVRAVPAADYPDLLSRYTEARSAGFRYANIGDLIYGAALETRTGKSWQSWLQQEVLKPLKLDQTHARSSEVPATQLTWNHRWTGKEWIASPAKPDQLMHAAGGLLASPRDLERWMRVNLQRHSPTGSPSARSFERAQEVLAPAKLSDGEFVCDGYSLGWYKCSYNAQRVLMHPGGYPGVVSVTLLVPSLDAGLSIVTTSDSAMEGLQLELMKAFIGLAFGEEGEKARLQKAVADYPARLARTVASRREAIDKARADAGWGGWAWVPGRSELAPYLGRFSSERLGEMEVVQDTEGLEARLGALTMRLAPAQSHLFAASASPIDAPETFRYAEDLGSLQWDEETFTRVAHFAE